MLSSPAFGVTEWTASNLLALKILNRVSSACKSEIRDIFLVIGALINFILGLTISCVLFSSKFATRDISYSPERAARCSMRKTLAVNGVATTKHIFFMGSQVVLWGRKGADLFRCI
ncbi:hypothetical protein D3C84_788060 [compost metagenome]